MCVVLNERMVYKKGVTVVTPQELAELQFSKLGDAVLDIVTRDVRHLLARSELL